MLGSPPEVKRLNANARISRYYLPAAALSPFNIPSEFCHTELEIAFTVSCVDMGTATLGLTSLVVATDQKLFGASVEIMSVVNRKINCNY